MIANSTLGCRKLASVSGQVIRFTKKNKQTKKNKKNRVGAGRVVVIVIRGRWVG